MKTHQVVDFGRGPKDVTLGYPFEGTEKQCLQWINRHQETKGDRDRYALQEIPLDHGFTLIEMLMVLVVIIGLMALLLPAIFSVRSTAQNSVVKMEITNYGTAMTAFHSVYGCYPPSSIKIHNNLASWRTDPQSMAMITRIFPNFDFNAPPSAYPWPDVALPTNGPIPGHRVSHASAYPIQLRGAECLVFFLGGVLEMTQYTGTGQIIAWGQPSGFSRNPSMPFMAPSPGESREGPFYKLDISRFTDVDDDGVPEITDQYPNQMWPIVYVTGYETGSYDSTDLIVTNNGTTPGPLDMVQVYSLMSQATIPDIQRRGLNKTTFQIISPGRDGFYGPGGPCDTEKPVYDWVVPDIDYPDKPAGYQIRKVEADNVMNF